MEENREEIVKNRRHRTHLLKDTFQTRFILVSVLHFMIIILTLVAAMFIPIMIQLDNLASLPLDKKLEFANQFLSLHERVWLPVVVVSVLLILHTIFFSHRIAGPLYRFRTIFEEIGKGNLAVSANIRKDDYLKKEAEGLRDMLTSLRERVTAIDKDSQDLDQALGELKRAVDQGTAHESREIVKRVEEQVGRLRTRLTHFRTEER